MILAVMDDDGQSQIYSTNRDINAMQSSWSAGVPTISMQKHFYEESGKLQRLRLNVIMPGVMPQRVRNLQLFSSFKYLLTEKLNIEMAGMMHVDLDTPNGVAKARVSGYLEFD